MNISSHDAADAVRYAIATGNPVGSSSWFKTFFSSDPQVPPPHMTWSSQHKHVLEVLEAANACGDEDTAWSALESFLASLQDHWDGVRESSLDWRGWLATRGPAGRTRTSCELRAAHDENTIAVFIVMNEFGPQQVISQTSDHVPSWLDRMSYIISGSSLWLGQDLRTTMVTKRVKTWTL